MACDNCKDVKPGKHCPDCGEKKKQDAGNLVETAVENVLRKHGIIKPADDSMEEEETLSERLGIDTKKSKGKGK